MEVVEYKATRLTLERSDLDYLLDLVHANSGDSTSPRILHALSPTREQGVYEITPGAFVGRLGLPSGRWIDFRSRFPIEDVIELIHRSGRYPVPVEALRAASRAENFLIDAIANAFARELGVLVGQGLAKGYQTIRYQRPPYPGRIDVPFHLGRLAARPDRLVTLARRLTTDITENQILAAALDVLCRVPLERRVSMRLAALGAAFTRTSRKPIRADDIERIVVTNLTHRYLAALGLAGAILRSQSLAPRATGLAGGSLLFFMPKVWEAYVKQWLVQQWPGYQIKAPYLFELTNDGQTAEADATVWMGNRLIALYDAKYKWPRSTPDRGDIYQMVTYSERLGIADSTLIYPVETPVSRVTIGSRTVHMLGVTPSYGTGSVDKPVLTD